MLIHNLRPFQVNNTIYDKAGRLLVVQGTLLRESINLVKVYGPNEDNLSFFESLFLLLATLPGKMILLSPWLEIEKLSSKGLSPNSYLYSASFKKIRNSTANPFVKNIEKTFDVD